MKTLGVSLALAMLALNFPAKGAPWPEMVDRELANMSDPPSTEDLIKLAIYSGVESETPGAQGARARAWERLRAVPDFADRLASYIREEREKWISGEAVSSSRYNRKKRDVLCLMGDIPDPRVVKVLGEFLSDNELPGYEDELIAALNGCRPNAIWASRALGRLVDKPPLKKPWDEYDLNDAKVWELWYAQVKAGTRTFRFKGDPQEYNLRGPVSEVAEPVESRPRKNGGSAGPAAAVPESSRLPIVAIVAVCGLLGVALWVRRKRVVL
jgi:hypothetical protein